MPSEPINYEAVLADLEAKKQQIEAAIVAIRMIAAQGGGPPNSNGSGPSAFLGMSIPDATKKHLTAARQKQSTQEIMRALEAGGLPGSKYSTVYAVLRRREKVVGDIINMKGDWALAEWYPNYRKRAKEEEEQGTEETVELKAEKKSA